MTSHTLKNPTPKEHPDPHDLDASIERARCMLTDIPWLPKAFHRAIEHAEKDPDGQGGTIRVPKVYLSGKEYYPVLPNDALIAYSFFRVSGGRTLSEYLPDIISLNAECPVDLIVWANLQKIDKHKDYIFTEELIRDVLRALNSNPDIIITGIFDNAPEDIFIGYDLQPAHRDLLKYPYQAFRISMNLRYEIECLNQ